MRKHKSMIFRLASLLVFSSILGACNQATSTGPHLIVYSGIQNDRINFMIFDADGRSRQIIQLPADSSIDHSSSVNISPDGNWIAFHTGLIPDTGLTLNLFHIPDESFHPIAEVMTNNYEKIEINFIEYIKTLQWSPDGRYLAYAKQIEDSTSDVYIYDTQNQSTWRLTYDLQRIDSIFWSDDEEWVLYRTSTPYVPSYNSVLRAVSFGNTSVKKSKVLESGQWLAAGGPSPTSIFLFDVGDGFCCGDLRYINIESGSKTLLWKGVFADYAFDFQNQIIGLSADSSYGSNDSQPTMDDGLYLIALDGSYKKISDDTYPWLEFWGTIPPRFVGYYGKGVFTILEDGSTKQLSKKEEQSVSISPDNNWLAVYGQDGLDLFHSENELERTAMVGSISTVQWRPDSMGLFIFADGVYYLSMADDNQPVLLERCTIEGCRFDGYNSKWLR
jgi:WD40 repeat protein